MRRLSPRSTPAPAPAVLDFPIPRPLPSSPVTPGRRPPRRLAVALVALAALVAVLWLNAAPHRHADDWSEKHCAACQVVREGATATPAADAVDLVRPSADGVPRSAGVVPGPVEAARHAGPPPGRSPPALPS